MKLYVEKIRETLKTGLLILLFLGVLVMSGMYIASVNHSRTGNADAVAFDKLFTVQTDMTTDDLLSSLLLPRFMGFRTVGREPLGLSAGAQYVRELYADVGLYLYYAFSSAATVSHLTGDEAETLWNSLSASAQYIYVQYHSPLPHQLLQAAGGAAAGSDYSAYNRDGDTVHDIRDLYLLPDGQGGDEDLRYRVVARDENGTVSVFVPSASQSETGTLYPGIERSIGSFADIAIATYGENMQTYVFLTDAAESSRALFANTGTVLVTDSIPIRAVNAIETTAELLYMAPDNFTAAIRLFNFNPDKLNTYEESSDTNIYVETHGSLRIARDRITYTAREGGGISLSDFIGYGSSGATGDIYDITAAAQLLIEQMEGISRHYVGESADLHLSRVYRREERLVLEYCYYYDNIPVMMQDKPYGLLLESDGTVITVIDLCTLSMTPAQNTGSRSLSYTQAWAAEKYLARLAADGTDCTVAEMYLVYALAGETAASEYLLPDWYITLSSAAAEPEQEETQKLPDTSEAQSQEETT